MWLNKFGIYIIVCFAFLLRLISLNQSLWWDEAINVVYARQSDFWWFVTKYPLGDFHPPGWFIILWIWGHLFGWTEIAVRMPSAIFGVATVYLTYLIGKELFSKKVGLLAALMLSLAPLHIYYSQEARMYSLSALAVSFSIYSFVQLINRGKFSWIIFALSSILVLYSDYVAYFIFPVQLIYLLFFERQTIKIFLFSVSCALVFFIPWIFVFPKQLISGQKTALIVSGWREVVGGNSLKELILLPVKILVGRISFDNIFLYFGFIAVVASPFFIVTTKVKKVFDKKYNLILLWLIITPTLVWLASFFLPVFSYFRLLYILPAFYIAISVCLCKFSSKLFSILIALILIFELFASSLYLLVNNFQREDWRGAINTVMQNLDNQTLVIFENQEIPAPVKYYSSNLSNFKSGFSDTLLSNLVNKKKVFFFEYLADVYDPKRLVEQNLKNLNFVETRTYNFIGVGFVRLYTKL